MTFKRHWKALRKSHAVSDMPVTVILVVAWIVIDFVTVGITSQGPWGSDAIIPIIPMYCSVSYFYSILRIGVRSF